MANAQIDTQALTEVVNTCFMLSMDGRLQQSDRNDFLVLGKRLRGTLVNLLSALFDDQSQQFISATQELQAVNKDLKATAANLANIAATVNHVAQLIGTLDSLLGIATMFV